MKKLSVGSKLFYGIGQIAEQVKVQGFDMFVFFYFNQVLGLEGWLTGLAVASAIIVDAITDPLVGSLSDNCRSKFGRRHPFMFAAAFPLGIFWAILFFPPTDIGQIGLFCWLAAFAILIRVSMTFYFVPHLALGAEIANDYHERTSVVNYRVMFGLVGGVMTTIIGIGFFFPESSAYQQRLLNPAGYPNVAIFGGIVMVVSILLSAWGTRSRISYLPKAPGNSTSFTFSRVVSEFKIALSFQSFRALFFGICLGLTAAGLYAAIAIYMNIFFWRLSYDEIAKLTAVIIPGFILAGICSKWLHSKFDKRPVLNVTIVCANLFSIIAVLCHINGYFPLDASGEPEFETMLYLMLVSGWSMAIIPITYSSMMADVAHYSTTQNGENREGIFFSAISFAGKLASGFGHLLAGILLSVIAFPVKSTDPAEVAPFLVNQLAGISVFAAVLGSCSVFFYMKYNLYKKDIMTDRLSNNDENQSEDSDGTHVIG